MSRSIICYGLAQLKSQLNVIEKGKKVFVLFTGSKDVSTGESWCPDCVKAEPVLEKSLESLPENSEFITCYVGDRPT